MKVNNTAHIYTKVVSDGDINYLRFDDSNGETPSTLRIGDNGTTNAKTSRDLNCYADFELIPYTSVSDIPADMLVQGELAAAEEELTDQSDKHRYFRIANYLQPGRFVEDVDHEIYEYKTTQTYGDVERHADNIMGDGSPEIGYSWATIYLPFTARLPLEELDNGVKMYKAKWDSEKKKLQMKPQAKALLIRDSSLPDHSILRTKAQRVTVFTRVKTETAFV